FLDDPFEPSPYSPITRRFWNDVFIDVASLPELATSPAAAEALAEAAPLLKEAGREPLVDYRRVAAAKRRVLQAAAAGLFSGGGSPTGSAVGRGRGAFLPRSSAGAPPDPRNAKGQAWGNPPLHPVGIRAAGYGYVIDSVRRLMAQSRVLRIDHVMGLHRLFVLPPGRDASEGVYIRYRPEENYAILCLESERSGTLIVG